MSPSSMPLVALLAGVGLAAPSLARADCNGRAEARWSAHQTLLLLLNPMGAEHQLRVGGCVPLYGSDEAALALNHFEAGVSTYLSPIYFVGGGYVQLAPVSFFFVRAEIGGVGVWPIPLNGAGFYTRPSYDGGWNRDDLPADAGETASGWAMRITGVLRGLAELGSGLAVLVLDAFWVEHVAMDHGAYWVNFRDDLITRQADWVLANEAVVLLEARVPGDTVRLRFGAYSALRAVPASGYVGHQLGPIAMISLADVDPALRSLDVFVRLGVYTHHGFREGQAATMLGISADWDAGGI